MGRDNQNVLCISNKFEFCCLVMLECMICIYGTVGESTFLCGIPVLIYFCVVV